MVEWLDALGLARALGLGLEGGGERWERKLHRLVLLGGGEAARIEVLPDPVDVLGRVAIRREATELGVDGVARAELDLAVAHAGVEAVERPHGRPARDAAREVVDAAVARADEALRGVDVAHRAAEVIASGRDRHELIGDAGRV